MGKKAILFTEDKSNLLQLATYLVQNDWELISDGETAEFLEKNSIFVAQSLPILGTSQAHNDFTNILNLIMNTYIPSEEDFNMSDKNDTDDHEIAPLVCVNIVPQYEKLNVKDDISSISNKIDYKHISLIRAAAKNCQNVLILTDPEDYHEAIIKLKTDNISNEFRVYLATKALNLTAAYDAGISFSLLYDASQPQFFDYFIAPYKKVKGTIRGINAHQKAFLYSLSDMQSAFSKFIKIQGEEMGVGDIKNNFAVWNVVSMFLKLLKSTFEVSSTDSFGNSYSTQFTPATGFVFTIGTKFCIPFGAAFGTDTATSISKTIQCSPESVDGAVIGCSAVIDEKAAKEIIKTSISTIIAPDFVKEAREILSEKKSLRLIIASELVTNSFEASTIDGGLLVQISDCILFKQWNVVTKTRPTQPQIDAMALGTMISIATKSISAIIINDNTVIGISSGQTNPKKAFSIAIDDAQECFKNNLTSSDTNAEVLVSDDSIPFGDFIYRLPEIGVKAIIQPGGSSTDNELIEFCNEHEISMIFTGMTHVNF